MRDPGGYRILHAPAQWLAWAEMLGVHPLAQITKDDGGYDLAIRPFWSLAHHSPPGAGAAATSFE